MIRSCQHLSLSTLLGKAALAVGLTLPAAGLCAVLELSTGPGRLGPVSWQSIALRYVIDEDAIQRDWQLEISGIAAGADLPKVDLGMRCAQFVWAKHGPDCDAATLHLSLNGETVGELESVRWRSGPGGQLEFTWDGPAEAVRLIWLGALGPPLLKLQLERLELAALPAAWLERAGLDVLDGRLTLDLGLSADGLRVSGRWLEGAWDGLEGRVAAEGLDVEFELELGPLELGQADGPAGQLRLRQTDGEVLIDSIYLPPPHGALSLEAEWAPPVSGLWRVERFSLDDPGSMRASGAAVIRIDDELMALETLDLRYLELTLPLFWERWMEGPAAAAGFGDLELSGALSGSLLWQEDQLRAADLIALDVALEDPQDRLAVDGLSARVEGESGAVRSSIEWEAGRLWGLPLGPAGLSMLVDEVGLRLLQPFTIPMLDGGFGIDSLAWLNLADLPSQLVLDVRIDPVSLNRLTRALGLVELGGTLAGRFPGVQYQDQRLSFSGDIEIDAFSGRISVSGLEIERPFGTLPAVAAQIEFHRLDLLELTGAFDFGRMEGQMSGWMRDLRLLDWRPVAMDARLFTHEDVPRRRISQRAVDDLSSLGGAGGALLTGTVMRVFDDFPYRRVGLACRLSNNICYIDGVAPHPSGGFYIVEGRGLPRLDVVGHRRLVDFPQLLRQLENIRLQGEG